MKRQRSRAGRSQAEFCSGVRVDPQLQSVWKKSGDKCRIRLSRIFTDFKHLDEFNFFSVRPVETRQ